MNEQRKIPAPLRGYGTDWPWISAAGEVNITQKDLPKISIVTPSYNQGGYIEETIRSVLLQRYPNLEYVVVDGESTDSTLEVLEYYSGHINCSISERDTGQANAINKGFKNTSGEILAWLNSDDIYQPGVLNEVAAHFSKYPQDSIISGQCLLWRPDENDSELFEPSPLRTYEEFLSINTNWQNRQQILQPESFFRRTVYEKAGPLNEELYYCFDTEFWIEAARQDFRFNSVRKHWANLRLHARQKTAHLSGAFSELFGIAWKYLQDDWDEIDSRHITKEIVELMMATRKEEIAKRTALLNSTSYKISRAFTRFKVW